MTAVKFFYFVLHCHLHRYERVVNITNGIETSGPQHYYISWHLDEVVFDLQGNLSISGSRCSPLTSPAVTSKNHEIRFNWGEKRKSLWEIILSQKLLDEILFLAAGFFKPHSNTSEPGITHWDKILFFNVAMLQGCNPFSFTFSYIFHHSGEHKCCKLQINSHSLILISDREQQHGLD